MKAVILAGGLGTRISEESATRPKPMIEIGGRPILWHVMKIYAHHGITDFIICLGYRGYMIKEYFANFVLHSSDVTVDARNGVIEYHDNKAEPWRVTLADTGEHSMTGGRLKRAAKFLTPGETFCLTYGDGVSDIDVTSLLKFHKSHGKNATVTAVLPPGRFGLLELDQDLVSRFVEKPPGDNALINGGFFVLETDVLRHISGDDTVWELEPLQNLAKEGQLVAFKHRGFWQPMDTLRDKTALENLWERGSAPWKKWS